MELVAKFGDGEPLISLSIWIVSNGSGLKWIGILRCLIG